MILDEVAAVVFDLDGTLVRLRVKWDEVESRIRADLHDLGVETAEHTVWSLLETAYERDLLEQVEPTINAYEVEGAERSLRLPLADVSAEFDRPQAVCSLNCEEACRRALSVHGLSSHVDVVVGRDTVRPWKPDPAPLTAAVSQLGVERDEVVFVGDSPRDARTAEAADIAYRDVSDVLEAIE